jgi:phage tail P2-like protein
VTTDNRGKAFLVSDTEELEPALVAYGAVPGAIGWLNTDAYGVPYLFRAPLLNDIVVMAVGGSLMRYEARRVPDLTTGESTTVIGWTAYRSIPERALEGMQLFDLFDPDSVYAYYARMIGAVMAQLQATNDVLRRMRDPAQVPAEYLEFAAASVGVTFDAGDSEAIKRTKIAAAVPAGRIRGLDNSIRLRIRQLGYTGYTTESWRAQSLAYAQPLWHGGRIEFADNKSPTDGQSVTIGVTGYATVALTFRTTPSLSTDVAIAATAPLTLDNLLAKIAAVVTDVTAVKSQETVPTVLVESNYACVSPTFPALTLVSNAPNIAVSLGITNWRPPSLPPGWPALWLVRLVNDAQFTMEAYRQDGTDLFPYITAKVSAGGAYHRSRGVVVFYDSYTPVDGDMIEMVVGGVTRVFEFDSNSSVTPGNVAVPFTAGADSATILASLNTVVGTTYPALSRSSGPTAAASVVAGTGESGAEVSDPSQTWIEVFHGTRFDEPVSHTPSPMVTVHLNQVDGSPLPLPDVPDPSLAAGDAGPLPPLDDTRAIVLQELFTDTLPANSRVRQWVTDYILPDFIAGGEAVSVADVLTVTLV